MQCKSTAQLILLILRLQNEETDASVSHVTSEEQEEHAAFYGRMEGRIEGSSATLLAQQSHSVI